MCWWCLRRSSPKFDRAFCSAGQHQLSDHSVSAVLAYVCTLCILQHVNPAVNLCTHANKATSSLARASACQAFDLNVLQVQAAVTHLFLTASSVVMGCCILLSQHQSDSAVSSSQQLHVQTPAVTTPLSCRVIMVRNQVAEMSAAQGSSAV